MNNTKTDQVILKAFTIFHFIAGICMVLGGLIVAVFILKGYLKLGHLPVYGDPEVVTFNGLDGQLVTYAVLSAFLGFGIWTLLILVNFMGYKIINRTSVTIGIIGIVFCFVIFRSPQFEWLLD